MSGLDRAQLVVAPWSVGSALGLVVVAFVLTLLGVSAVTGLVGLGGSSTARTLGAGGVLLGVYAALFFIVLTASVMRGVSFVDAVGLGRPVGARWYLAGIGAAVVAWLFSVAFTAILTALGFKLPREDLAVFRLLPDGRLGTAIVVGLLVAVAPFVEEVVYRGVLLPAFDARLGAAASVVLSATVFSAAHLSLVGFVPLLVVGALFAWLFLGSRSLRVSVLAHCVFNALGVVALLSSKASGIL